MTADQAEHAAANAQARVARPAETAGTREPTLRRLIDLPVIGYRDGWAGAPCQAGEVRRLWSRGVDSPAYAVIASDVDYCETIYRAAYERGALAAMIGVPLIPRRPTMFRDGAEPA